MSFGGPLLVSLQFFNVFYELEGPKLDRVFQVWPDECQEGWKNSTPWSADCTPTDTAQDAICFPCSKATLLTHAGLTLLEDFHVLFSRAALQPLSPQRILLLRIVLCHMQHFMFYLSLRLVILECLIFQPVRVFLWDGFSFWYIRFSSHFGVRHKIGEAALDLSSMSTHGMALSFMALHFPCAVSSFLFSVIEDLYL